MTNNVWDDAHLMQDINRGLAIWFATRLDAREVVRRWWREEGVAA
jgi:hypothetical protein